MWVKSSTCPRPQGPPRSSSLRSQCYERRVSCREDQNPTPARRAAEMQRCMHVKRIAVAIALSICVAGCGEGTTGPKGEPGAAGRLVRRERLVLPDLLDHQDRRALKVLPDRRARQPQLVKAYGSRAPAVRRQLAEASATKTRCLWLRTVARVEALSCCERKSDDTPILEMQFWCNIKLGRHSAENGRLS
jgi:hypothetical protein